MKVMMMWHGGSSYAAPSHETDHEYYESLQDAVEQFLSRPNDLQYPCINRIPPFNGGPSAWVYKYSGPDADYDYPDWIIEFGPRGELRVERT